MGGGTCNHEKAEAWVRFLLLLVSSSFNKKLMNTRDYAESGQTIMGRMLSYLIGDPKLAAYLRQRSHDLSCSHKKGACSQGCADSRAAMAAGSSRAGLRPQTSRLANSVPLIRRSRKLACH